MGARGALRPASGLGEAHGGCRVRRDLGLTSWVVRASERAPFGSLLLAAAVLAFSPRTGGASTRRSRPVPRRLPRRRPRLGARCPRAWWASSGGGGRGARFRREAERRHLRARRRLRRRPARGGRRRTAPDARRCGPPSRRCFRSSRSPRPEASARSWTTGSGTRARMGPRGRRGPERVPDGGGGRAWTLEGGEVVARSRGVHAVLYCLRARGPRAARGRLRPREAGVERRRIEVVGLFAVSAAAAIFPRADGIQVTPSLPSSSSRPGTRADLLLRERRRGHAAAVVGAAIVAARGRSLWLPRPAIQAIAALGLSTVPLVRGVSSTRPASAGSKTRR